MNEEEKLQRMKQQRRHKTNAVTNQKVATEKTQKLRQKNQKVATEKTQKLRQKRIRR